MITTKTKYDFEPDYAIAPGDTLLEVMESLEMTQKELAVRTGLTEQTLTLTREHAEVLDRDWNLPRHRCRSLPIPDGEMACFQGTHSYLEMGILMIEP